MLGYRPGSMTMSLCITDVVGAVLIYIKRAILISSFCSRSCHLVVHDVIQAGVYDICAYDKRHKAPLRKQLWDSRKNVTARYCLLDNPFYFVLQM